MEPNKNGSGQAHKRQALFILHKRHKGTRNKHETYCSIDSISLE